MAALPLLLGIDLGTSSVKVALYDLDGHVQAEATVEYPILRPQPGFAEQEPAAWWHAVGKAARSTMAQARSLMAGPATVAAIGLSGQMHGVVLTDADGLPLANAVIWPDQRSGAQVRAITEHFGAERLVALTGSPVATGFMAATLRWMADVDRALLERANWALAPKDWLRLQMTGDAASDPSDGSGALLLDVQTRSWAVAMPAVVGFRADLLPPLRVAASVAGGLTASAAAHLDLPPGTPVATGAADAACALLGAGAADGRTLVVNLSTGGQLVLPTATPTVDLHGRLHTFAGPLEPGDGRAGWYHMGAVLNVGLAMRWLRDNVLGESGEGAYARMTALADQTQPGADGLLFLPYLAGERTPHMDPTARGAFLGLTAAHDRRHLVRAVIEGATMACADAYAVLRAAAPAPERVILAGGGARSLLWQQIVADVLGVPVARLLTGEQSARGAALLAGEAVGLLDAAEASRRWAAWGEPLAPDPAAHGRYQKLLELYRTAYVQNQALFHALSAFSQSGSS